MSCKVVSKNCDFFRSRSQISSRRFKNWWESSFHINLSSKKKLEQKKFFSGRKMILKILIFDFFFEPQKKNLENQKTDFQKTSRKKSIFKKKHVFSIFHFFSQNVDFFFENRNFQNYFSPRKNIIFCSNFFWWKVYTKTWFVPTFEVVLEF